MDLIFEAVIFISCVQASNDLGWRSDARTSRKYTLENGTLSRDGRRSIRHIEIFCEMRQAMMSHGGSSKTVEREDTLKIAFIS
jgi:hypothetical protein